MAHELNRVSTPDDLPEPTISSALYINLVSALVVALGPKKARVLVRAMAEGFAAEQDLANIAPIRTSPRFASSTVARRGAAAVFRDAAPVFLGRLARL